MAKKTKGAGFWYFKRFIKCFENIFSLIVRPFVSIKKGRVACWAYSFKQYSCNPRYLTEYILENNPEFEIYWIFRKRVDIKGIDKRIKCVRFRSFAYYKLINSAEFLITNARTDPYGIFWHKREGQKYAMLWHGGVPLKRIEQDAEDKLSFSYLQRAKKDSEVCDLMICGSTFQYRLIRDKFWYDGEILKSGIPRYDIFFDKDSCEDIRKRVFAHFNIPESSKIVLYAPTFRTGNSLRPYNIDWQTCVPLLKEIIGDDVVVLLRLHPNMLRVDTSVLLNHPSILDATRYHDMQELLLVSDLLITDYSSTMFDMSMIDKPCILYATDIEEYDRGYYFNFEDLPFPLAKDMNELTQILRSFDHERYRSEVREFLDNTIGMFEDGNASKRIVEWMSRHRL